MASLPLSAQAVLRRLVAEAIGTFFLLATVVGSGIMAEQLAGGNGALALLGNTLATGAILAVLITTLGPYSGGHFNPAVTLVFYTRGEISAWQALAYIVVQMAAALAGVAVAHAMFDVELLQIGTKSRPIHAHAVSEAIATFGLVLTILGTLRAQPRAVGAMVGLYISAGYWFTASTCFANPAVTIARAFTDTFSGTAPSDIWPFIVAQLTGGYTAALLFSWLSDDTAAPSGPSSGPKA